jgi:hypothetical protein
VAPAALCVGRGCKRRGLARRSAVELSGESVGGSASARLHGEAQTRELSRFLDAQGVEWLLCTNGMPEWEFNHEKDLDEEVGRHFPRLRDYVRAMADKGNGLLVLMG